MPKGKDPTKIFTIFSFFSIFIASLGLLELVSYSINQRMKEIGIRRILGATIANIVNLVSKDFPDTRPVLQPCCMAISFLYYQTMAAGFCLQDRPSVVVFLLAGFISIITCILGPGSPVIQSSSS
jgi:putative ABC transport system permease protein